MAASDAKSVSYKGVPHRVYFRADGSTPTVDLIKDGEVESASNTPEQIGSTRYFSLDLTSAEMDYYAVILDIQIAGITVASVYLYQDDYPVCTVATSASNSVSSIATNRTEEANFWKDAFFRFMTGALTGQFRKVLSSSASGVIVPVNPFTGVPAAGDLAILVNR